MAPVVTGPKRSSKKGESGLCFLRTECCSKTHMIYIFSRNRSSPQLLGCNVFVLHTSILRRILPLVHPHHSLQSLEGGWHRVVNYRLNPPCVEQLSVKCLCKVPLLFLFRPFMFRHFDLPRSYFQKFTPHSRRLQFLCIEGRGSTSFHLHKLQLQRLPIMFLACHPYY